MKKYLLIVAMVTLGMLNAQQNSMGLGTASPDESSILEIHSTTKGILPPRMTQVERDAITNPANGLVLYNSTKGCLQINKGTKTQPVWECIGKSTIKNPSTLGSAVVEYGTSGTCSAGLITGTMTVDSPLTNVNMLVYAKVTGAGTYEIATNPVNGIIFRGSGEFTASQVGQCVPVVLVGAGVPEQTGNYDFTLNTTPSETVSKDVEAVKIRFISVERYNGISPIFTYAHLKEGIAYAGEAVPASSTIEVKVETTGATSYNFTATNQSTGLTYTATGSFPISGTYNVVLQNNGVVVGFPGELAMTLQGASNQLELTPRIDFVTLPVSQTQIVEIDVSADYDNDPNTPDTVKKWMDRNLGASGTSYSVLSESSYGSSFQWGRAADGHERMICDVVNKRYTPFNGLTTVIPTSTTPSNNKFIITPINNGASEYRWSDGITTQEWNGVAAVNNPCPSGFRVPTKEELLAWIKKAYESDAGINYSSSQVRGSWTYIGDSLGNTIRKYNLSGMLSLWSSSSGNNNVATDVIFDSSNYRLNGSAQVAGKAVRCIKD